MPDLDRRRRRFLHAAGALGLVGACTPIASTRASPRVVVVGGGFGGATAAKYLKLLGGDGVDVTLVESNHAFVSCPLSNLVLGGSRSLGDLTRGYDRLAARVRVVRDRATAVDPRRRELHLARGDALPYERLILSPGIEFFFDRIEGLQDAKAQARFLHAFEAGAQTLALRRQLEEMPDGGVFAISIPRAPLRCPPAPYERACQVAWYLRRAKPRSKVLVLDGNEDVQAEKTLFMRAWAETYRGMVEYRHDYVLTGVDAARGIARFETAEDERADVLNVIPPHGAGAIARAAGAVTANDQWCEVDFRSFESVRVPNVHVLGDSIQVAPAMPKAGQMAHEHGKVAAAAVLALLQERELPLPGELDSVCYSFITDRAASHIASLHRYDIAQQTYLPVPNAGGASSAMSVNDGDAAFAWWRAIASDMLG